MTQDNELVRVLNAIDDEHCKVPGVGMIKLGDDTLFGFAHGNEAIAVPGEVAADLAFALLDCVVHEAGGIERQMLHDWIQRAILLRISLSKLLASGPVFDGPQQQPPLQ